MKRTLVWTLAAVALASALVPSVWAVSYDQNITAIFGSGNPNTGWTTDTDSGITLGLRGKQRYPTSSTSTANNNGTYSFATGFIPPANNRATWNWEWSINSGQAAVDAFDYYVGIDTDPSQGISYTTVNALTWWTDNEFGTSSTANGGGLKPTEAGFTTLGDYSIAQQSQNLVFASGNPNLDATYNYQLFAVAKGAGENGTRLADVGITVVVGQGGAAVPDAGSTLALLGAALTGLAAFRRKLSV